MNKLFCLISCPVDTFSGYGSRSRDFIRSLIKVKEDWDVKILPQRWGDCPFGALNPEISEDKDLLDRILLPQQITQQPDIWIQITVPNEMTRQGKFNILVTAAVETTIVPAECIQGANNADLVIVSSNHGKNAFTNSTFEQIDNATKQKVASVSLQKPVEVLFEGVDVSVFNNKSEDAFPLERIKESWCYLSVAHILQGFEQLEDRKGLGLLIKTFLETFKNRNSPPALILKSSLAGFSILEEEHILDKIDTIRKTVNAKTLPNIYLLHGELLNQEMNLLYNHPKVKSLCAIGCEGFGRPALEFSAATGKPVISSPWSGQTDFLDADLSVFVGGSVQPVHPSVVNQFLLKESMMYKADPVQLSVALKDVYENYFKNYIDRGKKQGYKCRTQFSMDKMTEKLGEIIGKHMPVIARPMTITLPKLAKPIQVPEIVES